MAKSDREASLKKSDAESQKKTSTDGLYFKASGRQALFKETEGYEFESLLSWPI